MSRRSRSISSNNRTKVPLENVKKEEHYEVEAVVDHRSFENKAQYLVKWKNYDDSFNQWLDEKDLNCDLMVKRFWSMKKNFGALLDPDCTKPKLARLDFSQIVSSRMKRTLRPNTFDYDFGVLLEKYQHQWRLKQSLSSCSRKVVVRIRNDCFTGSSPWPKISPEQKAKLDKDIQEWLFDVNIKNRHYGLKPLHAENNFDLALPSERFKFIVRNRYASDVNAKQTKELLSGCQCDPFCSQKSPCCPPKMDSEFSYRNSGKLRPELVGRPIFECNHLCTCDLNCANRTVQKGRQIELCIFRTFDGRGWGVKTLEPIRQNTFVIEYVGEVVSSEEADGRYSEHEAEYLFDLDFHDTDSEYVIDATLMGNESHFVNHCCEPNLRVQATYIDTMDVRLPRIAFFACRDILPGEELTFDYSMSIEELKENKNSANPAYNGRVKCLCGAENCRGFVFINNKT